MKKTTTLLSSLVLIIIFIYSPLVAQKSTINYDLSNYTLPYLKRHVLEFDFGLSNSYSKSVNQIDDNDPTKSNYSRLSASVLPIYNFYLNSHKLQIENQVSANLPNLITNNSISGNYSSKSFHLGPSLNYYGEFREFLQGKFFLEQDLSINVSSQRDKDFYEQKNIANEVYYDRTRKQTNRNASFIIPILAGWGRIERVEDARLAVYILNDLKSANQLVREVSEEDITQLASRISQVQNERFFDSRHKKIWELQQIDSLLNKMGLIDSGSIYYYTLLNDNWDYAFGPVRESGFSVAGGISPEFSNSKNNNTEDGNYFDLDSLYSTTYSYINNEIGGGPLIRISYEKPLNLYWQFWIFNQLNVSRLYRKSELIDNDIESKTNYKILDIRNQFQIGFGYFPNSRTALQIYITEAYNFQNLDPEDYENTKSNILTSAFNISLKYYISPRFRLDLNSRIDSDFTRSKYANDEFRYTNFDYYLNASLVYKLL
jgi:hypothetical protein